MASGADPSRPLADDDWLALKTAIARFENAWRSSPRPTIAECLTVGEELRSRLLIELVHIDLELRLKAGEIARVEEYLTRYPQLAGDSAVVLDLIAAEHELRRRGEPDLALDEYLRRFPQYQTRLAAHIPPPTLPAVRPDRDTRQSAPVEVPGYDILGPLGRGGMGVVFKARQRSLNRSVALKFLPEQCARDPIWLDRFRREALTASALNHPHICTIYDTGNSGGRPFLSMELIDGQTLAALVGQRLAPAELARLIAQAAGALAAAHAAGVVHRDIKPENLMVRADGIVKVLDFGLAHQLPRNESVCATDPGTRVGTALYMAPEQARAEAVGTAADVFALGLVLYELAAGRHPFDAETELAVLYAITTQTPPAPSRMNPEVPAPLDGLILWMLSKDPGLRPTAGEVAAVLTDLAGQGAARPGPARQPTVGRRDERTALRTGFDAAAQGRGLVLCVTGEPGLGKTTLVEDFLDDLAESGRLHGLARGRCSERLAGAEAYLPFLEALHGLLRGADGTSMGRMMKRVAPNWYRQLAPGGDDLVPSAKGPEPAGASQERLKRELGLFLDQVSRLVPLVLFLDDLHWADPSTVDLLAYLGGRCAEWRLLIVLAYRAADMALSKHPFEPVQLDLQGRGLCREVALRFLDRRDVERYLALRFPGHAFPSELATVVVRHTEGNPLFLVDLLRYLCDRGAIGLVDGQWTLQQGLPDLRRDLPASVSGLIRRKLQQLDSDDRVLLTAGGVQGNEFDASVVAGALGRDPTEVEERLAELDRVHAFVRRLREHELPDGTPTVRYVFVHSLYQNALHDTLQPTRRMALSAAVARELMARYGERNPTVSSELAFLFEAARDVSRAAEYFCWAVEHAVRVSANQEAIVLATRGLDCLRSLPDTPDRDRQELALHIALGVSLAATKGFAAPDVERTYLRARDLCQRLHDISALFPVLYGLWNMYLVRCELDQCRELAEQMVALAESQSDSVFRMVAHNVLQQPLFHQGELAAARRHQEQGLALYERRKHQGLTIVYGEHPGVGCQVYGSVTLWYLGYPDQALRTVRTSRDLAEALAYPFNLAQTLYFGAFTHLCRREAEPVRRLAALLMEVCREQGFTLLLAGGMVLTGWALTQQGRLDEGIAQMRLGLADWQATGALSHRPYHLALLAEALGRQNQIGEAMAVLDEARSISSATGERFYEAELLRIRGELLRRRPAGEGDFADEAETCFCQARDVARRQGAKILELRALTSLSRLYRQQGRTEQARSPLAESYGWFSEGFETRDLQDAKTLLEEDS